MFATSDEPNQDQDDPTSSSSLYVQRAEQLAERNVREWIRQTLRETFLQGFSSQLQNEDNVIITTNCSPNDFTLTTEQLQECIGLVRWLSDGWQQRLQSHRHFRTSAWIQSVFELGQDNLWTEEWTLERFNAYISTTTNNNITTGINDKEDSEKDKDSSNESRKPLPKDNDDSRSEESSVIDTNPRQAAAEEVNNSSTLSQIEDTDDSPLILPYSELRKLGRPHSCQDHGSSGKEEKDVLTKLKEMGESGRSYWPLDHQTVDRAAKGISQRQRGERGGSGGSSYSTRPQPTITQIRSTSSRDDNNDDENEKDRGMHDEPITDETSAAMNSMVVAALKRGRSTLRIPKSYSKRRRAQSTPASSRRVSETRLLKESPRQPSTLSSASLSGIEDLTDEQKEDIERNMIHQDDDSDEILAGLFGELKTVGKIHERRREAEKTRLGQRTMDQMTEKQRRRQERAYIKERLAPHGVGKNQDLQRYRSKILRTEQECENDDGTTTTRYFMEFDVGWSLIEFEKDGERRLVAFDGIQACLEEAPPTDSIL